MPLLEQPPVIQGAQTGHTPADSSKPWITVILPVGDQQKLNSYSNLLRAGTVATGTEIFVFTGNDPLKVEQMQPLIKTIIEGADIAVNDESTFDPDSLNSPGNICQYFLNIVLGLQALGLSSLRNLPFAMNEKALLMIGADLAVGRPYAFAKAVLGGLRVKTARSDHLTEKAGPMNATLDQLRLSEETVAEHLEAIRYFLKTSGARGGYTDQFRNRALLLGESI